MSLKTLLLAAGLALAGVTVKAEVRDQSVEMKVVQDVDLKRYLGQWFEIARFPNRFERGCTNVTANYALNADGTVAVVNSCAKSGKVKAATGKAWVESPGKLKVTFVPLLGALASGDYWIIDLKGNYSMAVVGSPKGDFGWILARKPQLAKADLDRALKALTQNGYDVSKLEMVQQGN